MTYLKPSPTRHGLGAVLIVGLAAALLLAAPAQAQRISLTDILNTQNQGAAPITACGNVDTLGSYVVVEDLNAVGDCLVVTADNVTINLGGHVLSGDGTGNGVASDGAAGALRSNIVVSHGTVTGFDRGIDLEFALDSTVYRVRATDNADSGIITGSGSAVTDNTALNNGINGIIIFRNSIVMGNVARGNGNTGIIVDEGNVVTGNVVASNGFAGLTADVGNTVSGNTAQANASVGIVVICPSNVFDNTALFSGNTDLILGTPVECNANNNVAPNGP